MLQWRRQAPATPLPSRLTPSKHTSNGRSSTAKLGSRCGLIPAMLAFGAILVALSTFLLVHLLPWDNANSSSSNSPIDRDSYGNPRSATSGNIRDFESRELEQRGLTAERQQQPYAESIDMPHQSRAGIANEKPSPNDIGAKDTPPLPPNPLETKSCDPIEANGATDANSASRQALWLHNIDLKV